MLHNVLLARESNRRAIRFSLAEFESLNAQQSGMCLLCGEIWPRVPTVAKDYPCLKCNHRTVSGIDTLLSNAILSVKEAENMTIEIKEYDRKPFTRSQELSPIAIFLIGIMAMASWGCVWLAFALAY